MIGGSVIKKKVYNYELTKYPNNYNWCYWGKFSNNNNKSNCDSLIINNRNKFIEEYNIIKMKGKIPKYIEKEYWDNGFIDMDFFDHVEVYQDNEKNYIIINSPYDETKNILEGWKEIYKMYDTGARTFMKKIIKKSNRKKTI